MRCVIIDEDRIAVEILEGYLQQTQFLKLDRIYTNPFDVIRTPPKKNIDIIFIEAELSYLSGVELLSTLTYLPQIIVLSKNKTHAADAFDIKATDFLLKPLSYPRFLQAANTARERMQMNVPNETSKPTVTDNDFMWVKSEYSFVKIPYDQILYIEGLKDYLKIYLKGRDKPVLTLNSLKRIEEKLPASRFLRVHRSFIISLLNVDCINRNQIKIGESRIAIGDNYKEHFYQCVIGDDLI